MSLINLKTNLKSLRYGNDQLGGGNSGQPYIKVPIPEGFNNLQLATNDFILRGGALAVKDSATDILRLGKMFADTKSPNGLLFIAKQNLLSRVAVRTQTSGILNEGIYTPLSTLAQAGVTAFGIHLNKQGINPFAGTGAYSNNSNLYGVKVKNNQPAEENRLVKIYNTKQNVKINSVDVLSYTGGPGAPLGVGKTNIRFANQRTGINNNKKIYGPTTWTANIPNLLKSGDLRTAEEIYKIQPLNNTFTLFLGSSELPPDNIYQPITSSITPTKYISDEIVLKTKTPQSGVYPNQQFSQNTFVYTQKNIQDVNKDDVGAAKIGQPILQDFRKKLGLEETQQENAKKSGATPESPDYNGPAAYEKRVNIGFNDGGGPGNKQGKNLVSYTNGSGKGAVDLITSLPLYKRSGVTKNSVKNDLVKFRIAVISNENPELKTFIHFRAFLDNFSDSYNATWNQVNYLGRGENFYTYNNYTRTVSMGWTVAAQSKQELIPMYKKLNYLASSLTPYYTPKGYMAGNLVQLTVGGYLYETVGIINSLTYDVPEESPWEIGINDDGNDDGKVKELPHIIRVTNFSFTPIQDFIPSIQSIGGFNNNFNEDAFTTDDNGYGMQRYISIANGYGDINSNYNYIDTPNVKNPNLI